MKTGRVVITGGAGFIGSHLAEELVRRGYYIIILDNLATGRIENIAELLKNGDVEFIQGSITELSFLQPVFKGVRYVFHQAALPSVPRSIANPLASHETNITGTLNVLLAARDNGVKKVIFASSSSVYGDTPTLPKREDMIPRPLSPYAVTKLAGEYYSQVFQEVYQLPTVCLRYFNVYGPRQDPNSQYAAVIPRFIRWAGSGESPIIFGDGKQTRDFTFVRDVVEANILAAESEACGVFNISRGERITVNRLAKLIIKLVGGGVELVHQPPRPGDIKHSLADTSRAKEAFSYESGYSLEAGLAETVGWFNDK
ncbi:MAG: SDR family oxidoreductase [Dehalococcoidales bacterium]|nr:SDR family oxidoreductase [Dehalococcoidales bacterium]